MTENTKKWLTVAGCLVVCAILVAVIASSFSKDKVTDDLLPPSSSQQGDVVVDPDSSTPPFTMARYSRKQPTQIMIA